MIVVGRSQTFRAEHALRLGLRDGIPQNLGANPESGRGSGKDPEGILSRRGFAAGGRLSPPKLNLLALRLWKN
jgi:hypothetical protein